MTPCGTEALADLTEADILFSQEVLPEAFSSDAQAPKIPIKETELGAALPLNLKLWSLKVS